MSQIEIDVPPEAVLLCLASLTQLLLASACTCSRRVQLLLKGPSLYLTSSKDQVRSALVCAIWPYL